MMKLRSRLAVCCAHLTFAAIRMLKRGSGSVFPGYVARKIDPGILSVLSGMIREKVIVVTGTNGKTTTNSMIRQALKAEGRKVVSNERGANLLDGVVTAFVTSAGLAGRLDADYACIEVDELSCVRVFSDLKPDCIVCTNLFRDQLDRAGELYIVRDRLMAAFLEAPEAKLVVNGDDACSYALFSRCANQVVTFGIDEKLAEDLPVGVGEMVFCPFCGHRLEYALRQYGQLGRYRCPACGFARQAPDKTVTDIRVLDGSYSYVLDGMRMTPSSRAPYNVYNTLAAYTALCAVQAPRENFSRVIGGFDYSNRRERRFTINGARVELHLAKNPVGLQQKLFLISKDSGPKGVVIQIDDTKLDGEDVSWLWDVDYRYLAEAGAEPVIAVGGRRDDMELCLKYDGIRCISRDNIRKAVERLALQGSRSIYVITNYSGLYAANQILGELQLAWKGDSL